MNCINQKNNNARIQAKLFEAIEVTSDDLSVSNEKMKKLEEKYKLVPTDDFQATVVNMLFKIEGGGSISHTYAKQFGVDEVTVNRLLAVCKNVLKGSSANSFQGCIDLVLWGANSDVALVAFYEQMVKTCDPAMWTRPERLTFVSDDKHVVERARLIAEVLFPNVKDSVGIVRGTSQCQEIGGLRLGDPMIAIPRIHFVTAVNANQEYFDLIRSTVSNSMREGDFLDDYFVFIGWERAFVCENFSRTWGGAFSEIKMGDDECVFVKVITDTMGEACRSYGILRTVVELSRYRDRNERYHINELIKYILIHNVDILSGEKFLDVYKHVQWINGEGEYADCLVFYSEVDMARKVLILKLDPFDERKDENGVLRDDEMKIAKKWMDECWRKTENSAIDGAVRNYDSARKKSVAWSVAYNDIRKFVVVMSWNYGQESGIKHSIWNRGRKIVWELGAGVNLEDMYGIEFKGVTQLRQPDAEQKKIVFDRRKYRKVRGGPGTGKTLTMLWHAAQVIENKHLPVMILGKTNTLTGRNLKKFAVTYCTQKNCSAEALKNQVEFSTVASFVCANARIVNHDKCLRSRCMQCVNAAAKFGKQKTFSEKLEYVRSKCVDCKNEYCIARQMLEDGSRIASEEHRQKCCDACKRIFYSTLLSGNADLTPLKNYPAYGCVMIDEGQGIPCEELQACYLITAAANRWREFYLFCDEEQHFRGGTLENDEGDVTKKVVRAPASGFGRFVTLTKNYRADSKKLLLVYNAIQNKMAKMYDIGALAMTQSEGLGERMNANNVFNVKKGDPVVFENEDMGFSAVDAHVEEMKRETGKNTLLVLCDDVGKLRAWNVKARDKGWVITHLSSKEEREEERRLRLRFGEREGMTHLTGTDCAQGQTFENVLYISTRENQIKKDGGIEELFTALTRARANLRIVDYSRSGWLHEMLKGFND